MKKLRIKAAKILATTMVVLTLLVSGCATTSARDALNEINTAPLEVCTKPTEVSNDFPLLSEGEVDQIELVTAYMYAKRDHLLCYNTTSAYKDYIEGIKASK